MPDTGRLILSLSAGFTFLSGKTLFHAEILRELRQVIRKDEAVCQSFGKSLRLFEIPRPSRE